MSSEYPTLKLPISIDQTKKVVGQVTSKFSGKLSEEENQFKLKVSYNPILDEEQLDTKLTLLASGQYKSKGFMLVWLSGFVIILSVLALVSARFKADGADKNELYYQSLSAKIEQIDQSGDTDKEVLDFKKLQTAGLQEVAINRKGASNTVTVAGVLAVIAIVLLLLAYRSKITRKRGISVIKKELLQKLREGGKNPYLDSQEGICEFRLFESQDGTDFIFEEEEGSVLLVYLISSIMTAVQEMEARPQFTGNEPLEEIVEKYKDQEIADLPLNRELLSLIEFP